MQRRATHVAIHPRPAREGAGSALAVQPDRSLSYSAVVLDGVTVTVYNAAGTQIGQPQAVDALGAWKLRVTNSVGSSPAVTVKSTSGGTKTQASTIK